MSQKHLKFEFFKTVLVVPTTPKFDMEPKKKSPEKTIPFGNHHFQVPCEISGNYMISILLIYLLPTPREAAKRSSPIYETFRTTNAGQCLGLTPRQGGIGHFQPGLGMGLDEKFTRKDCGMNIGKTPKMDGENKGKPY